MLTAIRVCFAMLALFVSVTTIADAHPLGNFTSNHLTRISVDRSAISLHYVLDDAEIPTFSLLRSLDANGRPTTGELDAWAATHATEIAPQLHLRVDGAPATLRVVRTHVQLRNGAAGLTTLYFTADYHASRSAALANISYTDTTLPGRIGWKDVVVSPAHEPTRELWIYPNALIGSPRDVTGVTIGVDATGAMHVSEHAPDDDGLLAVAGAARMDDLTTVLARNLSDPVVLIGALLIAIGLGALHALEPGHGKTLLAVSLVGARATVPQAAILAAALTLAHTAGVLAFGVVVLTLARYIVPKRSTRGSRSHPDSSSPCLARGPSPTNCDDVTVGAPKRARKRMRGRPRRCSRVTRTITTRSMRKAHARAHAIPGTAPLRFRDALIAAASGNVAPCPAALVVLLAAIATHRIGWGLVLIVAFSVGLALTLTGLGVAVVRGAAWLTKRPQFDRFAPLRAAVHRRHHLDDRRVDDR